jgi:hypothetical protein
MKIILSTYIAILVADWIWNSIVNLFFRDFPELNVFLFKEDDPIFIIFKITLFIISLVILAVKWWFEVDWVAAENEWIRALYTLLFWTLSAWLIISVILVFSSWASFLEWWWLDVMNSAIKDMYENSFLVQMIILNYNLIFIIPAVVFVGLSLVSEYTSLDWID